MRVLVTRKDRAAYPATAQRPLSPTLPASPAAVMLWEATGRLPVLALDFDAKNGHGPRAAQRDALDAAQLLDDVGLFPVADRGPTGGWHVYARLPQPAAAWEVRQVADALAGRFPTLDTSPLLNPAHGCIRPPGAPHRTGGYQRLTVPVDAAVAALTTAPPVEAWARLRDRIGATHTSPEPDPAELRVAAVGVTRRHIAAGADRLARTGHGADTYPSPSEARFAVVGAAVRAGWDFAQFAAAVERDWPWLASSYTTSRPDAGKRHQRIAEDFYRALKKRSHSLGKRPVRISDTSPLDTQGGSPKPVLPQLDDVHLALRRFTTHSRTHARNRRYSPTLRAVLAAVLWAGHVQGRVLINVGVRSLAEQAALSHETVASALHTLAEDGLLHRLSTGRGADADVWRINVELGQHARPARGRRVGVRPVFRTLGGHLAGEIYETLREAHQPVQAADIAGSLGYDRRRVYEALQLLAGWGLASHQQHTGWSVGTADPSALARRLGGWQHWHDQHRRHTRQRAAWRAWLDRHRPATRNPGQLLLDELDTALDLDDTAWIAEYAAGTSPPAVLQRARHGTRPA